MRGSIWKSPFYELVSLQIDLDLLNIFLAPIEGLPSWFMQQVLPALVVEVVKEAILKGGRRIRNWFGKDVGKDKSGISDSAVVEIKAPGNCQEPFILGD